MAGHALFPGGLGAADDGQFDPVRDHLDPAQDDWPPPRRAAPIGARDTAARGLDLDRDLLAGAGRTGLCTWAAGRGHDYHLGSVDHLPDSLNHGAGDRAASMAF